MNATPIRVRKVGHRNWEFRVEDYFQVTIEREEGFTTRREAYIAGRDAKSRIRKKLKAKAKRKQR
jgi:hypothetical protein